MPLVDSLLQPKSVLPNHERKRRHAEVSGDIACATMISLTKKTSFFLLDEEQKDAVVTDDKHNRAR
jgi:hypothetical protein